MSVKQYEKQFWKELVPFNKQAYLNGIPLSKLAAVAIYKLQESGIESSFNNIAIALFKMFPEKFKLTSFPEYPDFVRIDNTLRLDCRKSPKLVESKSNRLKGFPLTAHGNMIAKDTLEILEGNRPLDRTKPAGESKRNRYTRLVDEVSKSEAYKKFISDRHNEISRFEIVDFLHGTLDTNNQVLKANLQMLKDYAKQLKEFEQHKDLANSVFKFLTFIGKKGDIN